MNNFSDEFDLPSRETHPGDSSADARNAEESPSLTSPGRDASRGGDNFESGRNSSSALPVVTHAEDHAPAMELQRLCDAFIELTKPGSHHSLRTAAAALGKSQAFSPGPDSMLARYRRGGLAGLMPRRGTTGAKPGDLSAWMESLGWFIPAANQFWLLTNRTIDSGSVPEAIRRTISLPHVPNGWKQGDKNKLLRKLGLKELPTCPPELRAALFQREREGKDFVTELVRKLIMLTPATVHQYRNAKNAALDYLNAPGGMRLIADCGLRIADLGSTRLARAGELLEMDDATINFSGVRSLDARVGRVFAEVRRYGGEVSVPCVDRRGDVVHSGVELHGAAAQLVSRRGCALVDEDDREPARCAAALAVGAGRLEIEPGDARDQKHGRGNWTTVYSPHQKPFIEGLFNTLWTKLSVQFPGIDVGRFMGETDEVTQLLMACRKGAKDPRRHFPMLATVVEAFREVIAEKNRTPVDAGMHGRWVPEERWELELNRPKLPAESAWLFSPDREDESREGNAGRRACRCSRA